jgi:hypothetical protein
MSLEPPNLDDRRYQDILTELQQRIPRYAPEWTDWNESDPGTTLLELFAWLGESLAYRLNQVLPASYLKFLQLIGLQLQPALPSLVHLSFTPTSASPAVPILVPKGTVVSATGTDGRPVYFETGSDLALTRFPLEAVQVYDGSTHGTGGTSFQPFGASPSQGNAVYLGFGPADPSIALPAFPAQIRLHVVVPAASGGAVRSDLIAGQPAPVPPVTVQWEYLAGTQPAERWSRLNLYEDTSVAFTREGDILVEGPPPQTAPQPGIGAVTEPYFWIRCRLTGGVYPLGVVPVVELLQENTVPATSLRTVQDEALGQSSGLPNQQLTLSNAPVEPQSLQLTVTTGAQPPVLWAARDDLLASSATDTHYVLDANTGRVQFGDGDRGLIPPGGSDIAASYRYGGGARANVPAAAVSALQGPVLGVSAVTNARAAVGGQDVQQLDDLKRQAPAMLRTQQRVVTAKDFEAETMRVGGVARACAVPLAHPDFPEISVPGAVSVLVVPMVTQPGDALPLPTPALKEAVALHLDGMRPITAEVYVDSPHYREVQVTARIEIQPYASPDAIGDAVRAALTQFLSPLPVRRDDGSFSTPRSFGEDFYPTSLYRVILDVGGVVAVPNLTVTVDGVQAPLAEPVTLSPLELLAEATNASHDLNVVPHPDDPAVSS